MPTWLCPDFVAAEVVTGGDRYNARMIAALEARGLRVRRLTREDPWLASRTLVVDSLYYDMASPLRAWLAGDASRRLFWLVHWLPSSVRLGRAPRPEELDPVEAEVFGAPHSARECFVSPSPFISAALADLGVERQSRLELEPGCDLAPAGFGPPAVEADAPLRWLAVGNLVPGKGFEALLEGLDVAEASAWRGTIVGAASVDPDHAAALAARVEQSPALRGRIEFAGTLAPGALEARYADAQVFVSSSRMESYGLALAEARARGRYILTLDAGASAMHLREANDGSLDPAVGVLHPHARSLARALLHLADEAAHAPASLAARVQRAWEGRRRRSWSEAADELAAALDPASFGGLA